MAEAAAAGVYVEVRVDLGDVDRDLKKFQATAEQAGQKAAASLGKAEDAATELGKATGTTLTASDRLAKGIDVISGSSRTASGNLARMTMEVIGLGLGFGTVAGAAAMALGAIANYAASALRDTETLDDRLKAHAEVIKSIRAAYGEAAKGVGEYGHEAGVVFEAQLKARTERIKAGLADQLRAITTATTIASPTSDSFGLPADLAKFNYFPIDKFAAFGDVLVKFRHDVDAGTADVGKLREEIARLGTTSGDQSVVALSNELLTTTQSAHQAQQAIAGTAQAIGVLSAAANAGLVALNGYNSALRSLQMGVPEMARAINAQTNLTAARKDFDEGAAASETAMRTRALTERSAGMATADHTKRVQELTDTYNARVKVITGSAKLEEDFAKTLQTSTIAGLEGVARGNAQAQASYEARNKRVEEGIKLGMSETEANARRSESEKILAQDLKNVAAANKAKGASGGGRGAVGGGADGFDSMIARYEDQTAELKLQQEQASKTGEELYKLQATHRLYQAALKAGRGDEKGLADDIEKIAGAYAKQRVATDAAIDAQRKFNESVKYTSDLLSTFIEDVLTGSMQDALKSLGKSFLSASLDAMISGKGPLAGITGMAGTKDQQGGILGLLTSLPKQIKAGAKEGTSAGITTLAANDNFNFFGGIDAKQLAGGLTAVAGLAGAYGIGASASSVGMGMAGGALSGAMAGAALGSVVPVIGTAIGAIVGAIAGGGLGFLGGSSASKKAREEREKEAQENYRQAEPGIAVLRSQLRGESQNTLENTIKATLTEVQKGIDAAFFASKIAEANALAGDFFTYRDKAIADFQRAFGGVIDAMLDGLGPNSAFASARDSVKTLGETLKGFVSDAAYAFGEGAPQIEQAREAAKAHALSILDGAKSLSMVQTRMEEIRGAGVALQQLLVELGMSATDAAAAIEKDTIAAINRLKEAVNSDLDAKINDAGGRGYLNDALTLMKEISTLRLDGLADPAKVSSYLKLAGQELVDSNQLVGESYRELLRLYPELVGNVSEFTGALKGAAREADIAARKLAFADRLFAATNDNSTLEGQLAAYNRQAMREREEEIKKGSEALIDLEMAQAAERFNIIRDWNQKAIDDQKRAAEEARSFWQRFAKQIKEYTDGLRAGADSPLSPQARLAAAQSQYNAQLALAQGGDRDALSGITSYSSDLLDAAKAYYASSTGYQDIFASVIAQLEALPDQVSETQLIIDAIDAGAQATVDMLAIMKSSLEVAVNSGSAQQIAGALSTYFNRIDTNTSQTIDFNEMKSALGGMASDTALRAMFTRLDVDASGALDKMELIKTATQGTVTAVDAQDSLLEAIRNFTQSTNANANSIAVAAEVQKQTLASVAAHTLNSHTQLGNVWTQVNRTAENTRAQNASRVIPSPGVISPIASFATGGYVSGPGSATSDSISARLSNGEFVMRAAAVDRFGVGMLDQMNDNFRMPAVAMPVGGGANNLVPALLAKVEALTAEVKALRSDNNTGHARSASAAATGAQHVREGVNVVAVNTAAAARAERRSSAMRKAS